MNNINFEQSIDPFKLESLRLIYMKLLNEMQSKQNNQPNQPFTPDDKIEVNINYCPNCKDKLKNMKFELKDNEILCDHCVNKEICNIHANLHEIRDLIMLSFLCDYFVPKI